MSAFFRKLQATTADPAFGLVRVMVGTVFLSEGIQKFLFPATVGAGRFAKIGLPAPEMLAAVTGSFEIVCGTCVLLGLFVRGAVVPLLAIMAVAFVSTKLPLLQHQGFWAMAHEGRTVPTDHAATEGRITHHHVWAAATLVGVAALLILLPAIAATSGAKNLRVFDSFYRAGSLVFGGGHVVLPLLRAEVVPPGWISDDAFLAGYGAAQALPGPLFTFAAYLGTVIDGGRNAWLGGLWCLLAIFLPAWMLISGSLPFWNLLRGKAWTQAALRGANAAVVGVLLAALYNPVWKEGVTHAHDVAAVLLAFVCLETWHVPPWPVVALCAAAGQWIL